jgi:hypothetical protein
MGIRPKTANTSPAQRPASSKVSTLEDWERGIAAIPISIQKRPKDGYFRTLTSFREGW